MKKRIKKLMIAWMRKNDDLINEIIIIIMK